MLKKIVFDTSALMENNSIIEKFVDVYDIIINIITLEELNALKDNRKDPIRSKKAREAIKQIDAYFSYITFDNNNYILEGFSDNCNDNSVIGCAIHHEAKLYTNDVGMKTKAKILEVQCVSLPVKEERYRGYVEYTFDADEFNEFWGKREEYFKDYYVNQYIIIYEKDNPNSSVEYKFDGTDLVTLTLPDSRFIKGKNALQRCALDMLNNKNLEVCAVMGMVGSGKTYLCLQMALYCLKKDGASQDRILGIREPVGEGEKIGYLPGDVDDKTHKFFMPLVHSLNGGEQELTKLEDSMKFESTIPLYLKGTTYNHTIMMVDEAEDLTEKQLRLVGTRVGEESRLFFSGDYSQSVNNNTLENPLVKMCETFKGNPRFACVYLDEDVRSEASKMFATLFQTE